MRRHPLILAACLPIGAVINIAVAWACVSRATFTWQQYPLQPAWHSQVPAPWPATPRIEWARGGVGWNLYLSLARAEPLSAPEFREHVQLSGLPWRSLRLERHRAEEFGLGDGPCWLHREATGGWTEGLPVPRWVPRKNNGLGDGVLPVTPEWPGFALNTLVYASGTWLVLVAPRCLRRVVCRRRGQCARCGYDLKGLSGLLCPECGRGILQGDRAFTSRARGPLECGVHATLPHPHSGHPPATAPRRS